jgi:aryl-alcohol dehydrogenase-like predicted oxidoreductase
VLATTGQAWFAARTLDAGVLDEVALVVAHPHAHGVLTGPWQTGERRYKLEWRGPAGRRVQSGFSARGGTLLPLSRDAARATGVPLAAPVT